MTEYDIVKSDQASGECASCYRRDGHKGPCLDLDAEMMDRERLSKHVDEIVDAAVVQAGLDAAGVTREQQWLGVHSLLEADAYRIMRAEALALRAAAEAEVEAAKAKNAALVRFRNAEQMWLDAAAPSKGG